MKQVQTFLTRLVKNEGNLADQVESRQKQLDLANRLEKEGIDSSVDTTIDEQAILDSIQYEDEEDFEEEGDDDCLN